MEVISMTGEMRSSNHPKTGSETLRGLKVRGRRLLKVKVHLERGRRPKEQGQGGYRRPLDSVNKISESRKSLKISKHKESYLVLSLHTSSMSRNAGIHCIKQRLITN